jgi:two-component SAPR family response regulator
MENETMKPTVLDIGQCEMDHGSIRRLVEGLGARVVRAHTENEAMKLLEKESIDLVLVNRILDHDGTEGMSIIRKIVSKGDGRKVMLVSNYPEYQKQAVEAGAMQGFGKGSLRDPATTELLRAALEASGKNT